MSAAARALISFFLLLLSAQVGSGRGGGHVTTWDPNLFGGGWVCFGTAVTGCSQGFNATCSGVADDTAALTSFRSFAAAQLGQVKLYIPPGAKCNIVYDGTFSFTSGAHTLIVWAYGATFNNLTLGGIQAFFQDAVHQALISNANAGDTTVIVTDGNFARFKQKDWIAVTGIALQNFGYPPNHQFFEYRLIVNCGTTDGSPCTSATFTLESQLINTYKSTWPTVSTGLIPSGPATIFDLDQAWNTNLQWYGGTSLSVAQENLLGRDIAIYDLNIVDGNPTVSKNWWCFYCRFSLQTEIDKDNENVYFYRSAIGAVASSSVNRNITYDATSGSGSLNGTGRFVTVKNGSSFVGAALGTAGYGHSETLTLDGSNLGAFQCSLNAVQVGWLTYSSGTFSIANAAPNWANAVSWGVPGYSYFFGTVGTITNLGQNFTITAVRQDATNTYFDTDLVGSLPSLGQTHYIAQPAPTVTAKFMTGTSTPINASGPWCHL